jgi:hypothetical protein
MPGKRGIPVNRQPLAGSERPPHPQAKHLGPADANEVAQVQLIVRRRPGGPPLKDLDYFQRVPINARNLPSRQEFEENHGATQADLDAVEAFCRSHQLQVVESNRSRRWVVARGTVTQLNAAFAVELQSYQSPRGKYRGYEGTANLPASLNAIVEMVNGLDDRPVPVKPLGGADPPIVNILTPPQVAQLYNFPSAKGAGQTIGIYTAWVAEPTTPPGETPVNTNGYNLDDVTATLLNWGIVAPAPKNVGTNPGTPTFFYFEPVMDIAIATCIAPHASIVVYFEPGTGTNGQPQAADIISTLTSMIHPAAGDPVPTILSISYKFSADDENTTLMQSDYTQINTLFQDAANLGITVLTGCSDTGAYVDNPTQAQTVYPATDPYVLTCGGTTIGDITPSNFDEYVWNDTWSAVVNVVDGVPQSETFAGASGGGISGNTLFPVPPYQATLSTLPVRNGTGTAGRGIPDVAGNASPNSGYEITVNQTVVPSVGGTSIVAPLYAGLVALINEILNESVGFLNPTLYALANAVCRDVTAVAGPTNNNYTNLNPPPVVNVIGYQAGVGWDAITGWGSINGAALLSALQGLFQKSMTFIMDRTTFGEDEVTANSSFNQGFFVVVDGLKPSDFPGGGITTTSLTPPPTQAQLNAWAPAVPSPVGPGGVATNIVITPTAVSSEGPSLSAEVQRFTFTYQVTFPDLSAFNLFASYPRLLTLNASLAVSGVPDASAQFELVTAADPFFSSESNGGLSYLSADLRVFYAIQGSSLFGYPGGLGTTPADALAYIEWVAQNLTGALGTAPNGDSFENSLSAAESSALSLMPTVPGPESELNVFNFALARVRLNALSSGHTAHTRVFFRLFQSQTTATPYEVTTTDGSGPQASPPDSPYRQRTDGITDGQKVPLLGISTDGNQYVTVPCFASARVPNTSTSNNMYTQTDPTNVRNISPAADGSTVYAYFGAWLDTNQSTNVFPAAPGANPDGPFTPTQTVAQVLSRGNHQCLVVQIVDDEAPIPNNATSGDSDKIAQRNLAYTVIANPGLSESRLANHTFEIRPSPSLLDANRQPENLPLDELMIDWGNVPDGSVASIYLPAVAVADVLALAARMYTFHNLTESDPHTLECPAGGITYLPIPRAASPNAQNYAGLFSIQLPLGVKRGQEFQIVVRQVTSVMGHNEKGSANRRFIYGAFQISIPVSVKSEMLVPEERNLSVLRWIQESIKPDDRWYPVFLRYLNQLSGKVNALGGKASTIPATQTGIWPGLPGFKEHHGCAFTGKVDGIVYDRFGDFEAFILITLEGERHRFRSHEMRVYSLILRAWEERILTTVVARHDHLEALLEIVLHGEPPHFEH